MTTVVTDGITVQWLPGTGGAVAHLWGCGRDPLPQPERETMTEFVERADGDLVGRVVLPCGACHPILLVEDDCEPPIVCRYCRRQSDPEVAYYEPDYKPGGFVLCDDCAREVVEELGEDLAEA